MRCINVVLLFLLSINIPMKNGARILGAVLTPSFSHQVVFRPLWRELSLRGHHLVVLTTDPMKDPSLTNLTEIDLHSSYDIWNTKMIPLMNNPKNPIIMLDTLVDTYYELAENQFGHLEVQELIKNEDERFDLVIVEVAVMVGAAFSEKFKCPSIGVFSMDGVSLLYSIIGNPVNPITNPDVNLPFVGKLNFLERFISSVLHPLSMQYLTMRYENLVNPVVKKYFGESCPGVFDMLRKISLLFVNTNTVLNQIRPLMPNVIEIGGITHSHPFKPLPKDLQKHLDNATQGFIYFSLGTNVKSKDLPEATKSVLMETFSELLYKVLWKYEFDDLPGKPDNVVMSKWFPQQDIFKHPNIKLLITQGGIQSIEEAIYNHIPILGLPFYLDQLSNIKRVVAKGLGLSLDYKTLDKETFKGAIQEIIENPKYRKRVKKIDDLIKDQPMAGLEKAVWWTEYVIRHKGAKHLRSPLLDIPSYQYYLLDVIAFCLGVIIVTACLLMLFFKLLARLLIRAVALFQSKVKTE